jgi:hypothetical protein
VHDVPDANPHLVFGGPPLKCADCGKPFDFDHVTVDGKNYHQACLTGPEPQARAKRSAKPKAEQAVS